MDWIGFSALVRSNLSFHKSYLFIICWTINEKFFVHFFNESVLQRRQRGSSAQKYEVEKFQFNTIHMDLMFLFYIHGQRGRGKVWAPAPCDSFSVR
ncbi:hypothetical protein V1478_007945 [Vespula squamosa]|uniref:Uncharacterized protein n=1 Tax=Vespula squamosa TaxID=30214 RepID=A0ABD2AY81_VESSQ